MDNKLDNTLGTFDFYSSKKKEGNNLPQKADTTNHIDDSIDTLDFYSPKKEGNEQLKEIENITALFKFDDKEAFPQKSKLKVLIIDEDNKNINVLSSSLKVKYAVYSTNNFMEALKLISQQQIALVISEQVIANAGISGTQFMNKVRTLSPHTSRILMASPIDFNNARLELKTGDVFRLFKKPYNIERFLNVIDEATLAYLENSGCLANAAKYIEENAPNLNKEIQISPSISASANAVIIKCDNKELFEEIKANYSGTAHFIHAKDKEATIKILETTITKAIIYCLDHNNSSDEPEIIFISQIKEELSHLAIIILVDKKGTRYQDIITLLSQNIIYSYLPSTSKVNKICTQLNSAIILANSRYNAPILLKWPPAEKIDTPEEEDKETLKERLTDVTSKMTHKLRFGFSSIKKRFQKK